MNEQSILNKKAWEFRTYEAWINRDGLPFVKAQKILENPLGCLKLHQKYFQNVDGLKIANLCGSNGRKAVPLAHLGAHVTIFDISEGNKRYAMELAQASNVEIEYVVTDLYDIDVNVYKEYFDILYLEGGILHYFHDIDKLMHILYSILKVNGKMVLNDFHPYRKIISINPSSTPVGDYFDSDMHNADIAYKNYLHISDSENAPSCSIRLYNISEILNAIIKSGFIINEFNEHPSWDNEKLPGDFTVYVSK